MSEKLLNTRVLGTVDFETDEVKEQIRKRLKLAAGGAYPYAVREIMKEYGWKILSSDASDQEKEKAKLLICYSWWARALDCGIPKKYFEEFMLDNLDYLDGKPTEDKVSEKWRKYG